MDGHHFARQTNTINSRDKRYFLTTDSSKYQRWRCFAFLASDSSASSGLGTLREKPLVLLLTLTSGIVFTCLQRESSIDINRVVSRVDLDFLHAVL